MVVLFDFDGVVMDTETYYTNFWDEVGEKYLGRENFGMTVKGQSMNLIYGKYFTGEYEKLQEQMTKEIDELEMNMSYNYIAGVESFIKELNDKGIPTAIVTSSDDRKMEIIYEKHPSLKQTMKYIITADQFTHSKPHPECYQLAMKKLNVNPEEAIVFEDSIYGINAGKAAGAKVIGVATTNGRELIKDLTDYVIDDFAGMNVALLETIYSNK